MMSFQDTVRAFLSEAKEKKGKKKSSQFGKNGKEPSVETKPSADTGCEPSVKADEKDDKAKDAKDTKAKDAKDTKDPKAKDAKDDKKCSKCGKAPCQCEKFTTDKDSKKKSKFFKEETISFWTNVIKD